MPTLNFWECTPRSDGLQLQSWAGPTSEPLMLSPPLLFPLTFQEASKSPFPKLRSPLSPSSVLIRGKSSEGISLPYVLRRGQARHVGEASGEVLGGFGWRKWAV